MDPIVALRDRGGEVYLVGGAVRDKLYNRLFPLREVEVTDYDLLCRKLSPEEITDTLRPFGETREVGKAFGITILRPSEESGLREKFDQLEIAIPRREESTGPGYRDFKIILDPNGTLSDDVARRDATINAMIYPIETVADFEAEIEPGRIVDFYDGQYDLENLIWRAVGDPTKRFLEDPTRMLRAVRQLATYNLTLQEDTEIAITEHAALLLDIEPASRVRLTNEMVKTVFAEATAGLNESGYERGFEVWYETGLAFYLDLDFSHHDVMTEMVVNAFTNPELRPISRLAATLYHISMSARDWIRKWQLAAASAFDKRYIPLLEEIEDAVNCARKVKTDTEMRMLIHRFQKPTYQFEAIPIIVDAMRTITLDAAARPVELMELYRSHRQMTPLSDHDLKLGGQEIIALGFEGKQIGGVKKALMTMVLKGVVPNNPERLAEVLLAVNEGEERNPLVTHFTENFSV